MIQLWPEGDSPSGKGPARSRTCQPAESHWGEEMNDLASTLTGLAAFLSVPVVFVLLKSPVRLPSSKEMSVGDKPRWSEKRIVPNSGAGPTSHTSACMLGCFRSSQSYQREPEVPLRTEVLA